MPVAPAGLRWHEEVDIGIVGAGGCGLVAAHAVADAALKVTIWEKAHAAGGNTARSGGMIPGAGSRQQREAGIFETGEEFSRDVLARNGGRSDPILTRHLCESSATLVEWLAGSRGIALDLVREVSDLGHTHLRLHAPPSRDGRALITGLLKTLERRGITLCLSSAVLQLWTDADGAVIGVQLKRPKKTPRNVRCHKLILACGGFGADAELLAQHCPQVARLNYTGDPGSSGDALKWAADIGAATQDLAAHQAYATVAAGSNLLIPWALVIAGAILVNQNGERFADEMGGPSALVEPLRAQPGAMAYEIFDARILKLTATADPRFLNEVVPRSVRRADEAEGLARQFQIAPDALVRTLTAYNAAVSSGADPFGRTQFAEPLAAPFYGIRVTAALLQTQGGLAIDGSARVLRPDGTPIRNLHAGGGAAVGLSGPGGDGYLLGNGLLGALGWGKIAGEQAAHELLAERAGAAAGAIAVDPTP